MVCLSEISYLSSSSVLDSERIMAANEVPHPHCKRLVLDAGPLLSLSPLRGLAETYVTVPQVLLELKDGRAREHFERLGLLSGVKIEVRSPDAVSLAHGKYMTFVYFQLSLNVYQLSNGQRKRGITMFYPMLICAFSLSHIC